MEWTEDPAYPGRSWDLYGDNGKILAWILKQGDGWTYDITHMMSPRDRLHGTREEVMEAVVVKIVTDRMN